MFVCTVTFGLLVYRSAERVRTAHRVITHVNAHFGARVVWFTDRFRVTVVLIFTVALE